MKNFRSVLLVILFVGVTFDAIGDAQTRNDKCILGPTITEAKATICVPVERPRFWGRR